MRSTRLYQSVKRLTGISAVLLFIGAIGLTPGCYEHVVRSEGLGAREKEIHEPALQNERTIVDDLEDAVMGPKR